MQSIQQSVGRSGESAQHQFDKLSSKPAEKQSDADDATSSCSTCDIDNLSEPRSPAASFQSTSSLGQEALIIFDWDDTLFPTTWVLSHGFLKGGKAANSKHQRLLAQLAWHVEKTLRMAAQHGRVVIVTNAKQGWIESTCKQFMPSLFNLLGKTVSARSTYEAQEFTPCEWKRLAFAREMELFYDQPIDSQHQNIVSVGDSLHELYALKAMTEGVHNVCGKAIKFLQSPSIMELIEQHEKFGLCFSEVLEHNHSSDYELSYCDYWKHGACLQEVSLTRGAFQEQLDSDSALAGYTFTPAWRLREDLLCN